MRLRLQLLAMLIPMIALGWITRGDHPVMFLLLCVWVAGLAGLALYQSDEPGSPASLAKRSRRLAALVAPMSPADFAREHANKVAGLRSIIENTYGIYLPPKMNIAMAQQPRGEQDMKNIAEALLYFASELKKL